MDLSRAPQTFLAGGIFLAGLWLGQLVEDPTFRPIAGVLGAALILAWGVCQLPAVRRRVPALQSKRSRLSWLWSETTEVRSALKRDWKAQAVDLAVWEPKLRDFVGEFWEVLSEIEPEDWRREKIKITDFDVITRDGGREPATWARRMLAYLEQLRGVVSKRMDEHPLA